MMPIVGSTRKSQIFAENQIPVFIRNIPVLEAPIPVNIYGTKWSPEANRIALRG
jgi:hypothetical protein